MNWFTARGLPEHWGESAVKLDLLDRRQKDGWSCGPTAAAIVLAYHGKPVPPTLSASPIDGMDPLSLVPIFRRSRLNVLAGEMDMHDLKYQTQQHRPVICLVRLGTVGHYVVVAGVVRGKVHYQCPESGPQTLPTKEFVECWHDVARDCVYRQFGISVWRE